MALWLLRAFVRYYYRQSRIKRKEWREGRDLQLSPWLADEAIKAILTKKLILLSNLLHDCLLRTNYTLFFICDMPLHVVSQNPYVHRIHNIWSVFFFFFLQAGLPDLSMSLNHSLDYIDPQLLCYVITEHSWKAWWLLVHAAYGTAAFPPDHTCPQKYHFDLEHPWGWECYTVACLFIYVNLLYLSSNAVVKPVRGQPLV